MMAKYAISAHGACALRILADNILLRSMDTERAGWQLKTSFDSYNDKIGTYADDISLIIEQEKCFLRNSTRLANDIKKLSAEIETLVKQNDCPQEVIANMVKEPNILDIYFVIDTSESMKSTLEAVNPAIEEIIPELKDISEYTNVDIRLNILVFSLAAQWYNKEPSSISSFEWKYLESGGAAANVGEAFVKLEEIK